MNFGDKGNTMRINGATECLFNTKNQGANESVVSPVRLSQLLHTVNCSKYIECSPHLSCIKTTDNCCICFEKDTAINSHYKTFKNAFLCLIKMEKEIQWNPKSLIC